MTCGVTLRVAVAVAADPGAEGQRPGRRFDGHPEARASVAAQVGRAPSARRRSPARRGSRSRCGPRRRVGPGRARSSSVCQAGR